MTEIKAALDIRIARVVSVLAPFARLFVYAGIFIALSAFGLLIMLLVAFA